MRATITIDDDRLDELMALTGAKHRTAPGEVAVR